MPGGDGARRHQTPNIKSRTIDCQGTTPRRAGRFLIPVDGRVISNFGPKAGGLHNDGINIAAPEGAPIKAAENGVVVYAGNELRGYGNLLLVRHSAGGCRLMRTPRSFAWPPVKRSSRGRLLPKLAVREMSTARNCISRCAKEPARLILKRSFERISCFPCAERLGVSGQLSYSPPQNYLRELKC